MFQSKAVLQNPDWQEEANVLQQASIWSREKSKAGFLINPLVIAAVDLHIILLKHCWLF